MRRWCFLAGIPAVALLAANFLALDGQILTPIISGKTLLITQNLAGLWLMNEGSGGKIYERFSGSDPNLFGMPEQYLKRWNNTSPYLWRSNGATITDNFAANPVDGSTTASRFEGTAVQLYQTITTTAQQYTQSVYLKSNTGSSLAGQLVVLDPSSGFIIQSITITTSWQRFSMTWTGHAGNTNIYPIYPPGGVAQDIVFYHPQVEAGSTATPIRPLSFTMGMNATANSSAPSWTTGAISITSGTFALGGLPNAVTLGTVTLYALAKQTGDPGAYAPYLSDWQVPGGPKTIFGYDGTTATPWLAYQAGISTSVVKAPAVYLTDSLWHIVAASNDGSTTKLYVDGQMVASKSSAATSVTNGAFAFGTDNTVGFYPGVLGSIGLYTAVHTQAQIDQMTQYFKGVATAKGVTPPASVTEWLMYEGDSITDATSGPPVPTAMYPWLVAKTLSPGILGWNNAVSGSFVFHLAARAAVVDATIKAGRNNILFVLVGTNDLANTGTAAALETAWASYMTARRTAGWNKIIACTLTSTNDATKQPKIDTFNTWLHANYATYADALSDFAADANLGCGTTCGANTTYFSDGLHPTAAGQAIMAPIAKTAIQSVR